MRPTHSFCNQLLKDVLSDDRCEYKSIEFSAIKSSLRGYEVTGPGRFFFYASSACCVASAKAEAISSLLDQLDGSFYD